MAEPWHSIEHGFFHRSLSFSHIKVLYKSYMYIMMECGLNLLVNVPGAPPPFPPESNFVPTPHCEWNSPKKFLYLRSVKNSDGIQKYNLFRTHVPMVVLVWSGSCTVRPRPRLREGVRVLTSRWNSLSSCFLQGYARWPNLQTQVRPITHQNTKRRLSFKFQILVLPQAV